MKIVQRSDHETWPIRSHVGIHVDSTSILHSLTFGPPSIVWSKIRCGNISSFYYQLRPKQNQRYNLLPNSNCTPTHLWWVTSCKTQGHGPSHPCQWTWIHWPNKRLVIEPSMLPIIPTYMRHNLEFDQQYALIFIVYFNFKILKFRFPVVVCWDHWKLSEKEKQWVHQLVVHPPTWISFWYYSFGRMNSANPISLFYKANLALGSISFIGIMNQVHHVDNQFDLSFQPI